VSTPCDKKNLPALQTLTNNTPLTRASGLRLAFWGMILSMSDYPRTLLEFQHLFPDETACARHLECIGRSQRVRVPTQPAILADGDFRQRAEDCRPSEGADVQGFL